MSEILKLRPVNRAEISAKGASALADRPNAFSRYGKGALSASELKAWFDQIGFFLADKINEIQSTLCSENAADYIAIGSGELATLGDLVRSLRDGSFAQKAVLLDLPWFTGLVSVQEAMNHIVNILAGNSEDDEILFAGAGFSLSSYFDAESNSQIIKLMNRAGKEVSKASVDLTCTSGRMADGAVTYGKIAEGAVGAENIRQNAVRTEKIAEGAVDETRLSSAFLSRIRSIETGAFSDVEYNPENGELSFISASGVRKSVDLPMERMLVSARFEGEDGSDENDALVFEFVTGDVLRVPTAGMLKDLSEIYGGEVIELYLGETEDVA